MSLPIDKLNNFHKIKIIHIYLILFSTYKTVALVKPSNWLKIFVDHFSSDLKAYQLRFYKNTTEPTNAEKFAELDRELSQKFGAFKIDLSSTRSIRNGTFTESNFYSNAGPVIFAHHQDFHELNDQVMYFLEFYDKSYPIHARPKCLIIFEEESNVTSDHSIKALLEFAWTKKFLDATVLQVSPHENQTQLYTFNPFLNEFKKSFLTENSDFFPNKLRNLNKYSFRTPIAHLPPYMTTEKDANGKVQLSSGHNYKFLKVALMLMNLHHEQILFDSSGQFEKLVLNQSVNMYSIPHINLKSFWAPLLILHDDCIPYVGIMVPEPIFKFNISIEFLTFFIYFPITLITIKCIITILHLKNFDFEILEVIRLIFGMPLLMIPKKIFKRILIVFLFFTSMLFSIDLVTHLLNNIVVYDEVKFNSMEDITKSDYKLAMNVVVRSIIFNTDKGYDPEFIKKKVIHENIVCPHPTMKDKTICVLSMLRAKGVMKNSNYKMIGVNFACNVAGYPFERASPYIDRFKSVFMRMYESGIYKWILKEQKKENVYDEQRRKEIIDNLFLTNLTLLLLFGYSLSLIGFVFEILFHYVFSIQFLQVAIGEK